MNYFKESAFGSGEFKPGFRYKYFGWTYYPEVIVGYSCAGLLAVVAGLLILQLIKTLQQ